MDTKNVYVAAEPHMSRLLGGDGGGGAGAGAGGAAGNLVSRVLVGVWRGLAAWSDLVRVFVWSGLVWCGMNWMVCVGVMYSSMGSCLCRRAYVCVRMCERVVRACVVQCPTFYERGTREKRRREGCRVFQAREAPPSQGCQMRLLATVLPRWEGGGGESCH